MKLLLVSFVIGLGAMAAPDPALGGEAPAHVISALEAALVVPGARLELAAWRLQPRDSCRHGSARLERPLDGSGRYPVRLSGKGCESWGWATVKVYAQAFVTTRPVRAGEPFADAVKEVEEEVRSGRTPATVADGAKASRSMGSGQLVTAAHLDSENPGAGSTIKVVVRAGSLGVTQSGRAVPCGRGRACAILPTGKHVEGIMQGGMLVVDLP